nr:hypothetical protein [Clostridioides difficile]
MYPNVGISPVSKSIIQNFDILIDLIYNPGETEFLRIGNSMGKKLVMDYICWWGKQ